MVINVDQNLERNIFVLIFICVYTCLILYKAVLDKMQYLKTYPGKSAPLVWLKSFSRSFLLHSITISNLF